ncbi:MAG: 2-amino-4-hydroxy-6-hydroxymethyldihydropteridine diphosphokinase [Deltaproteobacteria bacterium]|jgi:2-amino-4-hydroxy-6-hydroxymethyldihydropteridine diphosphokinase|nr:2-amino-4-hydroxy-6-hydroxymethyldihydropteridine diphosphokinase [Deltaproteobacteria bacterium]
MTALCAIGLGANLGDPESALERAINLLRLNSNLTVTALSSTWLTEPVGGPSGQNWYFNRVVMLSTDLIPLQLLAILMEIESQLGRIRRERWGPRLIDLDLLFRNQDTLDSPELTLPHPRLHERAFMLFPLREVCPEWVHPIFGLNVGELLLRLPPSTLQVQKLY